MSGVCNNFVTRGYCRFGSSCRFLHPEPDPATEEEEEEKVSISFLHPKGKLFSIPSSVLKLTATTTVGDMLAVATACPTFCGLSMREHWPALTAHDGKKRFFLDSSATLQEMHEKYGVFSPLKKERKLELVYPTLCVPLLLACGLPNFFLRTPPLAFPTCRNEAIERLRAKCEKETNEVVVARAKSGNAQLQAVLSEASAEGAKAAYANAMARGGDVPETVIAPLRASAGAAAAQAASFKKLATAAAEKALEQEFLAVGAVAECTAFEKRAADERAAASAHNNGARALDALFVVAQHDACVWADTLLTAGVGSLCHAARREEKLWGALTRAESKRKGGRTRLMFAASKADAARVDFLLKANKRPEYVNALRSKMSIKLTDAGPQDVYEASVAGSALLHAVSAVRSASLPRVLAVVRLLLDAKADPSTPLRTPKPGVYWIGAPLADSALRNHLALEGTAPALRDMVEQHEATKK